PLFVGGVRHVGTVAHHRTAVLAQHLGVGTGELVLGRARQGDVTRHLPHRAPFDVPGRSRPPVDVLGDPAAPDLLDVLEDLEVDALLVDDIAGRVRTRDDPAAQLLNLLDRVQRHVPGAGHHNLLAVERVAPRLEDLLDEEDRAVAGGLLAHLGPAPGQALAGEHPRLVAVGDPLVLAEQVAPLRLADAGGTGRDVGVLADVAVQLGHERLAEPHHLAVGAALGVEVRAALAAPDG